jgi:hypothetical protein
MSLKEDIKDLKENITSKSRYVPVKADTSFALFCYMFKFLSRKMCICLNRYLVTKKLRMLLS